MKILGIETSCDETAAAVVEDGTRILSNIVASSQALHAKYGGIIPEKAAREQVKAIVPVIREALTTADLSPKDLDAVAVTFGPGLIGSLLIGTETAKTLVLAWDKPLIPVNHLLGHIYANWLNGNSPELPAVVLLVSGGHTELILMSDHGRFKYLGGTLDDAAGECFDKSARLLGLGYPGGPAIEKAALKVRREQKTVNSQRLPRPMINEKNFDFSFSGLKTAVANASQHVLNKNLLALELEEAVSDVLVKKTLTAVEKYRGKSLLLAGGVAANQRLRKKMKSEIEKLQIEFYVPEVKWCTDNAAGIASAAFFNYRPVNPSEVNADPSLSL